MEYKVVVPLVGNKFVRSRLGVHPIVIEGLSLQIVKGPGAIHQLRTKEQVLRVSHTGQISDVCCQFPAE